MRGRYGYLKVAALLVGIAASGVWTTAGAQARPTRRVPVRKEQAPPQQQPDTMAAAQARQDSIAAAERARQDSIARAEQARRDSVAAAERARQDSIAAAERARQDSIARAEAARREEMLERRRGPSGPYIGIAGGVSIPVGDYGKQYKTGWNVTVPLGWDFAGNPFGIRVDGAYDRHSGKSFTGYNNANVAVWSLNADLKARFRWGSGTGPFGSVYLLGGGGAHKFVASGGSTRVAGTTPTGETANGFATTFSDAKWRFGWNAGGGVSFDLGRRAALFIESRYFSVDTNNPFVSTGKFVPVIIGFTF